MGLTYEARVIVKKKQQMGGHGPGEIPRRQAWIMMRKGGPGPALKESSICQIQQAILALQLFPKKNYS